MSSLLRRRGNLAPLAPALFRDLQEEEDDPFFVVYSSPCTIRLSNDPDEEMEVTTKLNPCKVTHYDCAFSEQGENIESRDELPSIVIDYDYELYITKGANFDQTIFGLEASMLEHLASATGLVACPVLDSSYGRSNRKRALQQELPEIFGAVSSDATDTIDEEFKECAVPVQSSISSSSTCQPMKGSMTVNLKDGIEVTNNVLSSVQSSIQRFVRSGMNSDIYVTGNVRKVSFIGTRAASPQEENETPTGVIGGGNGPVRGSVGVGEGVAISVAAALIVFGIMALLFHRKRREDQVTGHFALDDGQQNQCGAGQLTMAQLSMANRDSLALKPADDTDSDKSDPGFGPDDDRKSEIVSGSSKSSDETNKNKTPKRTKGKRRKKSPILDASPSLESIPEEADDDSFIVLGSITHNLEYEMTMVPEAIDTDDILEM